MGDDIVIFDEKKIRRIWDEKKGDWFFSVVDVVGILSGSDSPRKYWNKLAQRLREEGSQVVTDCHRLKLKATDGKMRETDVADKKVVLRIIQSIPSRQAEPFKVWLAQVGSERLDEVVNPELSIDRAMRNYFRQGKSREWINQRLKSIEIRKELTDEWLDRGIKEGVEFGILTNEMLKTWSGMNTGEYKNFKGLKKECLRDNMTNLELVLNMLAEASTTEISKKVCPKTFDENRVVARDGGKVAGSARKELEGKIGTSAISSGRGEGIFIKSEDERVRNKREREGGNLSAELRGITRNGEVKDE